MSRATDVPAGDIAERVQDVLGFFDGDLADFLAHEGVASSGQGGAMNLVRDAQLVALMMWELGEAEMFNEEDRRQAALLIWRLLKTARSVWEAEQDSR